jgi:hypothetical protein
MIELWNLLRPQKTRRSRIHRTYRRIQGQFLLRQMNAGRATAGTIFKSHMPATVTKTFARKTMLARQGASRQALLMLAPYQGKMLCPDSDTRASGSAHPPYCRVVSFADVRRRSDVGIWPPAYAAAS